MGASLALERLLLSSDLRNLKLDMNLSLNCGRLKRLSKKFIALSQLLLFIQISHRPPKLPRRTQLTMAETDSKGPSKLPVVVNKPTPYTFDLGLLLASDPNPLLLTSPENLEDDLVATARDGAQALLNQLLSTCPIASTPNGVLLSLPGIETRLPREKVCSLFPLMPYTGPPPPPQIPFLSLLYSN